MAWKASEMLMETIKHYSGFPATGVSLRQMVQFGEKPSTGTPYSLTVLNKVHSAKVSLLQVPCSGLRSSYPKNFQFA